MDHRAVARAATAEVVPFDAAREAVSFRDAGDVDAIAGLEARDGHRIAHFTLLGTAKLSHEPHRFDALLLEVAGHCTRHRAALARLETERDGVVAVRFLRPPIDDRTGTRSDHRHRDRTPVRGEDAGHPDFTAQDVLHSSVL